MKTRKFLVGALALALVAPAFQSCKKGEEDPFISLKSRTSRITGTWTLKSFETTTVRTETEAVSNDVNGDTWNSSMTTTTKTSYDGTNLTSSSESTGEATSANKRTDWQDSDKWKSVTTEYTASMSDSETRSFSMTVSLYNDNSSEFTTTMGTTTKNESEELRTVITDGRMDYTDPFTGTVDYGDSDETETTDTTYTVSDESSTIENSVWMWMEGTNSDKLYVDLGNGYTGKLIELSSNQMILETQYTGNTTAADNGSETDIEYDQELYKQDDSDPFSTKDGDITTVTTWDETVTTTTYVFEKTDKESDRTSGE